MGVLMVPKYPRWQERVATAIQEFDAQRLRQKFLRCSFVIRGTPQLQLGSSPRGKDGSCLIDAIELWL